MELIAEVNPAIVPIVGKQRHQWNRKNPRGELVPADSIFISSKPKELTPKEK
jgi:hypothetical protein